MVLQLISVEDLDRFRPEGYEWMITPDPLRIAHYAIPMTIAYPIGAGGFTGNVRLIPGEYMEVTTTVGHRYRCKSSGVFSIDRYRFIAILHAIRTGEEPLLPEVAIYDWPRYEVCLNGRRFGVFDTKYKSYGEVFENLEQARNAVAKLNGEAHYMVVGIDEGRP